MVSEQNEEHIWGSTWVARMPGANRSEGGSNVLELEKDRRRVGLGVGLRVVQEERKRVLVSVVACLDSPLEPTSFYLVTLWSWLYGVM